MRSAALSLHSPLIKENTKANCISNKHTKKTSNNVNEMKGYIYIEVYDLF